MSSDRQKSLLQEYGHCDKQIGRLDTLIWQTASIIYPISLAGLAYFGSLSVHTAEQFLIVVAVALGSVTLLAIWYFLACLWFRLQLIAFYRMQEIEAELGMWRFRYSAFMAKSRTERDADVAKMTDDEQVRLRRLEGHVGPFRGIGLRTAAAYLTVAFLIGLIAIVVREYILTFLL